MLKNISNYYSDLPIHAICNNPDTPAQRPNKLTRPRG